MKVLINNCYGGFGYSDEFVKEFYKRKGIEPQEYHEDMTVDNPEVIALFEELGSEFASGSFAQLKIVEIPDGLKFDVGEYDGQEWISNTWIKVTLEELSKGLTDEQLQLAEKATCIKIR
jgi:hypothetical protein